jgi:hypothetical protein
MGGDYAFAADGTGQERYEESQESPEGPFDRSGKEERRSVA